MIYKVLKECVIESAHFNPGELYGPSDQMSERALKALLHNGFLEIHAVEPRDIKVSLPDHVIKALQAWVDLNDNPIRRISLNNYNHHKPDSDGYYNYDVHGYIGRQNKNLAAIEFQFRTRYPVAPIEQCSDRITTDYMPEELGLIWKEKYD